MNEQETKVEHVTAADIVSTDMPTPKSAPSAPQEPASPAAPIAPASHPSEQVDSAGIPFDPVKHLAKKFAKSGRWIPRSTGAPRKHRSALQDSAPSYIPSKVPPPPLDESTQGKPEAVQPVAESALTVDHSTDAGEVFARGVQLTAGIVLDASKDCTATPQEHAHMVNATAAFIRAKGWQAAAGVGLFLMFAAWLLKVAQKDRVQERIKGWLRSEKDVTPEAARPAGPHSPAPSPAPVVELSRGIPPLAGR